MSYMHRALELARQALGSVSPNPAVGAVVVKDRVIVGEGYTQPPGQDHAEVVALKRARASTAGGTLYTTLEPCNHHGRTRPCTEFIIGSGVVEVHAAVADPNTTVLGNGLSRLNEVGIRTYVGEGQQEARKLMEAYLKFATTGLPFVTAKFAASLDGKIATRTGESRWISSEESRRYAHGLRAASDAIMVGINTALADDPQLTARDDSGAPLDRQPLRIVVDSRGRLPPEAVLLHEPGRSLVAVTDVDSSTLRTLTSLGAEVKVVPAKDGLVDLSELMRSLGQDRSITSVLVEGGGTILGSLFDSGLVDKVIACIAPTVIGGQSAPTAVGGTGVGSLVEAARLKDVEVLRLGTDVAIVGYR